MDKLRSIAAAGRPQETDFLTVFGEVANFPEVNAWSVHAFDSDVTRACHALARRSAMGAVFRGAKRALEMASAEADEEECAVRQFNTMLWCWRDEGVLQLAHRVVEAERNLERVVCTVAQNEARRLIRTVTEQAQCH